MNLTKLFDMQRVLDKRIIKEKGLEGQDLLPQKILALQVELGECANEWRGFKFWSNRQTPKEPEYNWKPNEDGSNLEWKPEYGFKSHPLLEEYIDCLHFILSIGNDISYEVESARYLHVRNIQIFKNQYGITEHFSDTFTAIAAMCEYLPHVDHEDYEEVFLNFLALGEMLGFTWGQIEAAYTAKNAVNHDRQSTGY